MNNEILESYLVIDRMAQTRQMVRLVGGRCFIYQPVNQNPGQGEALEWVEIDQNEANHLVNGVFGTF